MKTKSFYKNSPSCGQNNSIYFEAFLSIALLSIIKNKSAANYSKLFKSKKTFSDWLKVMHQRSSVNHAFEAVKSCQLHPPCQRFSVVLINHYHKFFNRLSNFTRSHQQRFHRRTKLFGICTLQHNKLIETNWLRYP